MSTHSHSSDEGEGSHGIESSHGILQPAGHTAGAGAGQSNQQAALEWLTAALTSAGAVSQPATGAQRVAESLTLPLVGAGAPATTAATTGQDPGSILNAILAALPLAGQQQSEVQQSAAPTKQKRILKLETSAPTNTQPLKTTLAGPSQQGKTRPNQNAGLDISVKEWQSVIATRTALKDVIKVVSALQHEGTLVQGRIAAMEETIVSLGAEVAVLKRTAANSKSHSSPALSAGYENESDEESDADSLTGALEGLHVQLSDVEPGSFIRLPATSMKAARRQSRGKSDDSDIESNEVLGRPVTGDIPKTRPTNRERGRDDSRNVDFASHPTLSHVHTTSKHPIRSFDHVLSPVFQHGIRAKSLDTTKVVNFKFDGSDYLTWSTVLCSFLDANDLLPFVNGDLPKPTHPTAIEPSDSLISQEWAVWKSKDAECRNIIMSNVSKSILSSIVTKCETACDMWNQLRTTYHLSNPQAVLNLKTEYQSHVMKRGTTLDQYIKEMDLYVEKLRSIGKVVDESDQIGQLIQGLPKEYEMLIPVFLTNRNLTYAELCEY